MIAMSAIALGFRRSMFWCGIDILHWIWGRRSCSGKRGNISDCRANPFPGRFGTDNRCDGVGLVAGNFRQAEVAKVFGNSVDHDGFLKS